MYILSMVNLYILYLWYIYVYFIYGYCFYVQRNVEHSLYLKIKYLDILILSKSIYKGGSSFLAKLRGGGRWHPHFLKKFYMSIYTALH